MKPLRKRRSVSLPIVLSVLSVGLSIALLVGWTLVMLRNAEFTKEVFQSTLLLVAGIASLCVIMAVLVLFTVFLVREILEVRRQTSFIDSVTHELKSPLASLKLCLETMGRPQLDEPRRDALRTMMAADIARLSGVIDGILEASRVDRSHRALEFDEIDLECLVRESVRAVCNVRDVDANKIGIDIAPEIAMSADAHALQIIVENLLDNAIKYSDNLEGIQVRAWVGKKGELFLEVSDRGIGIARRDLKRIFDRFYRAPEEHVRERHGTGLGLFVVAAFVRELGGKIEADSPGLGHGSSIRIRFPRRRRIVAVTSHRRDSNVANARAPLSS